MENNDKIHRIHFDNLIAKQTEEGNNTITSIAYDYYYALHNIIIYLAGFLVTAHLLFRIQPYLIEQLIVLAIIYIIIVKFRRNILISSSHEFKHPFEYWVARMSNIQKKYSKEYFEQAEWKELELKIIQSGQSYKKIFKKERYWIYSEQARKMIAIISILIVSNTLMATYGEPWFFFTQRIIYSIVFIFCTNKFWSNFCIYKNALIKQP